MSIVGAIAVVGAAPGELTIVAIPAGYVPDESRPASKPMNSSHSVKSACKLLRSGIADNHHPQAHSAVFTLKALLRAPYAILTPNGIELSDAQTFGGFLKGL